MSSPSNRPASKVPLLSQSGVEARDEIRHFVDQFSEGLLFLHREWRIAFANESARRIEPCHINGAGPWEIYSDTVGTRQEDVYRASIEKRVSLEHECCWSAAR